MFKPFRLPSLLHPYPSYFVEYLPHFTIKDHIIAEKHLEYFHNFIDNFEIMHEDVVMRLFLKSFARDAKFWFWNLKFDSIGSWEELHDVFLKYWGKNESYDQFLSKFYSLKREDDEPITKFNWRFQSFYISMLMEIRPSEKLAMLYYVMAQHSNLVFFLLERC